MKSRFLRSVYFHVPSQKKRLPRFVWAGIFLLFLSFPLFAGDDVQQIDADEARRVIKQAEKLTRKGNFLEAEKLLRELLKRDSQNSRAKLNLAYVLMKQKILLEAYDLSYAVAKAEPKNAYAFSVLGMTFLNAGNFREANFCFDNALKLERKEALAWAGFGMLDFYENRMDQSIDALQNAVYLEPDEPDYIFALAQVSARSEKYKEAAAHYERFLQIAPPTDKERRDRIKGLINFLRYLGNKQKLYQTAGEERTVVPVRLLRDRPVIQVRIGKHKEPLKFVLDTGSGISVINEEVSERLKIKPITKGGLARGIGGGGKFEIIYGFLPSLSIGEVKIQNVPVYIRKFHANQENIDGYIGLGLISKFLTTLDYGALTFALVKRNESEIAAMNNLPSLPLRLTSSGYLSGEVQVEGVEAALNFIVDTGASISVISDELANTDEINRHISDEKMRVVGAAGITEDVPSFLLPRLSFGSHSREKIKAIALDLDIINETSGFTQAGILGGNFLKNYRLTFDFKNSRVTFEPVAGSAIKPE
jgi:tetratricopeptide (TPR) repeat protein